MRIALLLGVPVWSILGTFALVIAFTFERCRRACVSPDAELAVIFTSTVTGLILLAAGTFAAAAWLRGPTDRRQMARISLGLGLPGLLLFPAWLAFAIWMSIRVTT